MLFNRSPLKTQIFPNKSYGMLKLACRSRSLRQYTNNSAHKLATKIVADLAM